MKRFKYKKSRNEESLQPILKVVTDENNEDKIYQGKAKSGLISYLLNEEKQGKVQLLKSGDINSDDSLKHIIISPCGIEAWEKLNKGEKLDLRTSYIEKLQVDFRKYNYLLAIEEKSRKNDKGEDVIMEHYHLVISSKIDTGSKFKNQYKKSLMNNYIENYTTKDLREKLNVKTHTEILESKSLKMKQFHDKKLQTQLDYGELSLLHGAIKSIFKDKNLTLELNRRQKYNIFQKKQDIFDDLSHIRQSVNNSITFIKTIDESIEYLAQQKHIFIKNFHKDLSSFKKDLFTDLKEFTLYSRNEHSFFVLVQKQKAKNGIISAAELLTSISRSKNYWKSEEISKRRTIENQLLMQQEELKKQLLLFESKITILIDDKNNQEKIKHLLNQNIKFKKLQVSSLDKEQDNLENRFQRKINHYNSYIEFIENKISSKKQNIQNTQSYIFQNKPQI